MAQRLYAGKYKTLAELERAYKELERAHARKGEEESQMRAAAAEASKMLDEIRRAVELMTKAIKDGKK